MSTFEQQLAHYADLAVQVGVNIQPNHIFILVHPLNRRSLYALSQKKRMMQVPVKFSWIGTMISFPVFAMRKPHPIPLLSTRNGK